MDDTTSTAPIPDRDEVVVRVGPTAAEQESEFLNATLQFNGTVAYSIATYLAVPDGDVEETAETLRAALAAAADAVPGLRFVVEVGPTDD